MVHVNIIEIQFFTRETRDYLRSQVSQTIMQECSYPVCLQEKIAWHIYKFILFKEFPKVVHTDTIS